jgi:hypothetical protein
LGSEINSGGKIDADINKRIQNSSDFYQITNGYFGIEIPKQCKTIIYNVYLH